MRTVHAVTAVTVLLVSVLAACDPRGQPTPQVGPPATAPGGSAVTAPSAGSVKAPADAAAADRRFIEQAASSGMAEVEIAKHTMGNAATDEVKKLAEHLHRDRSRVNQELLRIAAAKGMTLPAAPAEAKHAEVDRIRSLRGVELDHAVLDTLAQSHRGSIRLFEHAASDGGDPALQAFAAKTLPTLRSHLAMVEGTLAATGNRGTQTAANQ